MSVGVYNEGRRISAARSKRATRSLDQDEWWTDKMGKTRLIAHMSPSHRRSLLNYLRRWSGTLLYKSAEGQVHGMDPIEWIESKPLIKRLIDLVEEDERKLRGNARLGRVGGVRHHGRRWLDHDPHG